MVADQDDIAVNVAAIARIEAVPTLLRVLCDTTGMRFAAVARVTQGSWTACAVQDDIAFGLLPGGTLDIDTTLCKEVRASRRPVIIEQASLDPVYSQHHTPRMYGFESYVSVPIELPDGEYFGNLCALDPQSADLSAPRILSTFKLFAQLIGLELDNERKRQQALNALLDERATSELREQFIAVLGHDLRNPLGAVIAGTRVLQLKPTDAGLVAATAERIDRSVRRMSALIDDVLDFARGRLGGGIGVAFQLVDDLGSALATVVSELQEVHPGRQLQARIDITSAVRCDRGRIQQLVSNLLGNALAHGAQDHPVRFTACTTGHELVMTVWNSGEPIPPESLDKVFNPFWRRSAPGGGEGLGLGLYICAQIVRSHGGKLATTSTREDGTTFMVSLPLPGASGDRQAAANGSA